MRHTFAGAGLRFRPGVVLGAGGLCLLLQLAVVACGGENSSKETEVTRGETGTRTTTGVEKPTPPPQPVPTPVAEPEEDSIQEEEPGFVETEFVEPREVTYEEAEAAFLEGRYEKAVELFVFYTGRRPENAWGHYMLALSAWRSGDPVGAEESFRTALELDPTHEKSLVNLARVLLEQDRPQEALEQVEKAVELNPESNQGQRVLGRVRYALGQSQKAIESYKQAILIDESDVWAMNNLGLIYIRESRFEDALLPLARATELESGVATFQNNLGIALERTGHRREAGGAYRSTLEIDEGYDKAAVSLARVENLEEVREAEPVDLSALSLRFQERIQSWRDEKLAESTPEEKSDTTEVGVIEVSGREQEDDS